PPHPKRKLEAHEFNSEGDHTTRLPIETPNKRSAIRRGLSGVGTWIKNLFAQHFTRREPQQVTPAMFQTWLVIITWLILAGAAATVIYAVLHATPGIIGPEDSGLDVVQIVLAVMAGLGAVLLGVYAYRRQRLQEVASARDDQAQFLERYNAATSQLADDKAAARLAGIYAMARLADDWPDQRQQCVDVLCAYLRMPPAAAEGDPE